MTDDKKATELNDERLLTMPKVSAPESNMNTDSNYVNCDVEGFHAIETFMLWFEKA